MIVSCDFETYSDYDLGDCGLYRYMESPNFEILLLGYAIDDGDPIVLDFTAASPEEIEGWKHQFEAWLQDPAVTFHAYNAEFEINAFSHWLGYQIPLDNWWDTMVTAASCGLPRSLKDVGIALRMPEDDKKLKEGKALVRFFCMPCAPTKTNGGRTRNTRLTNPDKWETFITYNAQDVVAERAIWARLKNGEPSKAEHDAWILSTEINRRGVMIDRTMAQNAVSISEAHTAQLMDRMKELTGLGNPNSVQQLSGWLGMDSLSKDAVAEALKTAEGTRAEVLALRREAGKSSVKKYQAMLKCVCDDDRVRGMYVFYGASKTGRYSSKLVQIHNLPQNHIDDLALARHCVETGDRELMEILYDDIPDTMSQLIRTAFIPRPGYTFAVADFSAIEARVIAWLANEKRRMDLFAKGGDIYCQSASQMFGVPVEKHGVNGHLRQKGKIAELACIAKGSTVATDHGLKPIEEVTLEDKVWDGGKWVNHDGVVYRGEKEVISYMGLTATPDHLVYVRGERHPIPFVDAMVEGKYLSMSTMSIPDEEHDSCIMPVYDILNCGNRHRFCVSGTIVHNCGYGGSVGAMINMGATKMGIPEEELQDIVDKWRAASPHIVKLWWEVDRAVKSAVQTRETYELPKGITVRRSPGWMHITLPSGRVLRYFQPKMDVNRFGGECVSYEAYEEGRWGRVESYGPKFVENLVQGISRDCLIAAMTKVSRRFPRIVMHVHDEMIVEVPKEQAEEALQYMQECMGEPIDWAPGLLLRGDGYITDFYRKD